MDVRYGQSLDVGKLLSSEDGVDATPKPVEEVKAHNSVSPTIVTKFLDVHLSRILLAVLIILSMAVLVQPQNLERIDVSVQNSLVAQLKQQVLADVVKEFPDASAQQKLALVEKKLLEIVHRPEFEQNVNALSAQYKSFYRDKNGQTFLYSADPYYYFRLARNLVEHGSLTDGNEKDVLRSYPFGDIVSPNVFPYVLFYFFKIVNFVSLATATFYFPVFAGVLSVLLVFFIAKRVSGLYDAFLSALVFSIHPTFLFWNYAGYADTQVVAMAVSLASVLLFLYGIDFSHKIRALFSWLVLFALLNYAKFVWSGLFFVPLLIIFVCAAFAVIWLLRKACLERKYVFILGILVIIIASGYLVYHVTSEYRERISIMLNIAQVNEVFPTSFSSITELEGAKTIGRFVAALGGGLLVVLVLIELLFFVRSLKDKIEVTTLLPWVWLVLFVVPAFLSARFLFFVTPPLALIAGRAFARIGVLFDNLVSSVLRLKLSFAAVKLSSLLFAVIIVFVIVNPSPFVAKTKLPLVTKSLVDAAEFVRVNSKSDAVIASWWDLGYAWQAFSRRATFFDGGLFKTPRGYWTARALLSNNESVSSGVLKMMNCGDDIYFGNGIVPQSYVLCNKTNSVFIVITEPMLYQLHLYDYYVKWDFNAARLRQEIRGMSFDNATAFLQSTYNFSEDDAVEAYYTAKSFEDVVPEKHVGEIGHCRQNNATIFCSDGLIVDVKSMNATIEGVFPKSLVFVSGGKRTVVSFKNSKEKFSAVVYQSGSEYRSVLMDADLTDALIVRMFTGEKLSSFEQVFVSDDAPNRVVVYKIK
ncbi:hypothetical protein HY485_04370 [Candidatus Woesearchaeota archaeon]|nr:hypothetical protein [Candidatus Woesearchaeota archaeon]